MYKIIKWLIILFILIVTSSIFFWQGARIIDQDEGDPDPDGYYSSAELLKKHGVIDFNSKRPPGFPLIINLVDCIGPGNAIKDTRYFNLIIGTFSLLISSLLIMRFFGIFVMSFYAVIFPIRIGFENIFSYDDWKKVKLKKD
jgi:hypothetical protein